ncbi:8-oxo-dGTP diphosphatase [Purpureocillium takamizusanense]|uniref:8-oxo-dGTP diphosphatase n=1 Tax=Purpureocillium takamizusanense TaxID=2060973 RepID=A0A9Q8VEY1_9HYPO|nr:8-oxo-dGTP diphosphatase [Purpureocillium takamizusanense]UNI23088.1 8-oxo-dGTP diphosphatase [Purpureocillium takamizusanense]
MSGLASAPKQGTSAFIVKGDKILVGQRLGSHGAGSWQLPGGHCEPGEGFFECAVREVKEETFLDVDGVRLLANTYDAFPQNDKHYVTWFVLVEMRDDEAVPKAMEPDKCASWHWMSVADLRRKNMFLPLVNLFDVKKTWDAVLAGSAPLIRLPATAGSAARNLLVRWDTQPGSALRVDAAAGSVTLGRGRDLAVVDPSPGNTACSLQIVVPGPHGEHVFPLGNDVVALGEGATCKAESVVDGFHKARA